MSGKLDSETPLISITIEKPGLLTIHYGELSRNEEISFDDVIAVFPIKAGVTKGPGHGIAYIQNTETDQIGSGKLEKHSIATCLRFPDLPESLLGIFKIPGPPAHFPLDLESDQQLNCHVIVSIKSGICNAESFFTDVVQKTFEAIGIEDNCYKVHRTSSDQSINEFVADVLLPRANQGVPQTVLILSGDGGIVDIVNVLLQASRSLNFCKPSIGLLAMGTGNALANSTGLNGDSTRGLRSFLRGKPHNLPTFVASFSSGAELLLDEGRRSELLVSKESGSGVLYGAVVCSWALHASLVADSDTTEYRKHGSGRFQMAAQELLNPSDGSKSHVYRGRITLFKKDESGNEYAEQLDRQEHMYVLSAMVSNLEEKLTISPHSKPLDGQLRLLDFGALPSEDVMRIFGMAFSGGEHINDPAVSYRPIEGMRIDFEDSDGRWRRICVDGTIVLVEDGGWVEVRKEPQEVLSLIVDVDS
ncbi:hypothetical protein MMC19_004115 [Ptychographa xylographoides]|nr:hypothetical protein [Ptychographa xylographoides]